MRFLMSTFDEVKEDVYCQHIHLVVESFFIKSFSRREIHHLALDTFLSSLSIGTSWSKSISNRSSSEGDTLFSKAAFLFMRLLSTVIHSLELSYTVISPGLCSENSTWISNK